MVPVLFFTVGPIIAFWLAVFIWHLWLSPGALVFEAIEQQAAAQQESSSTPLGTGALSVSPREKAINWAIWSQKSAYNLKQLAGILAKVDPSRDDRSPDRIAYLKLLQEEAMAGKLRLVRDRLAKSYWQPDLYPAYFSITKEDAISWAKSKNFDLSHIM